MLLLLSSCAYVLMEALRRLGLQSTELARAQVGTIRLKLLKIGAVITRNTRRVRIWFSSLAIVASESHQAEEQHVLP